LYSQIFSLPYEYGNLISICINLDLNLAPTAQSNVMPSIRLDVPDAHPAVPAICPNLSLTFDNRPITLHDSVLLHDSTAVAVAKGFVLPLVTEHC
jgi:hypothetical protein